jgi:hypothetical protein
MKQFVVLSGVYLGCLTLAHPGPGWGTHGLGHRQNAGHQRQLSNRTNHSKGAASRSVTQLYRAREADQPIQLAGCCNIPVTLIMALRWALECNGLVTTVSR